jgi:hypothetical protein
VSFETSFDSKQPKLEPKLVSALSKTTCLFWLFRFYTKTESFGVSIEPKQTEVNQNSLIESIFLYFFSEKLGLFGLFPISLFRLFRFYSETESFDVLIEPNKQKTN